MTTPPADTRAEPIAGYRLIERLGAGGFGEVWKAEAPGGIFKAIKIIFGDIRSKDADTNRFAEQELKSLKRVQQVRHPYLLALDRYDIVDGRLMIVMELADCNLWDRFKDCRGRGLPGIPRDELLRYMAEAAEVLDLMNDRFGLQHLDIKPQNLFLLFHHVKVADFGQVKDLEGMVTSAVTGGITPVYAAPETFDGVVTRYCDQYSLALVYQELLTGVRPFDGTSMQQLLMQHLHSVPNLEPAPPGDRPALARALAKKPEDRFPNLSEMIQALRAGTPPVADPIRRTPTTADPPDSDAVIQVRANPPPAASPVWEAPPPADTIFPARVAPPAATGDGPVRPALVIGLGGTGQRVLRRLRKLLGDRFGPAGQTPAVRLLYVDTDPDALAQAETGDKGSAPLDPGMVFPAKLNRAQHYLRPRLSGRSLVDGWFNPQTLYRLPRHPLTMGLRTFGRLAFCDHYRALVQKIQGELDSALDPAALTATVGNTGLDARTNRPRVYVVAGLAGGTGSGMVADVAYAVRSRLVRMGYAADVAGVLVVPADGPADPADGLGRANTYAALTELNHYAQPHTAFTAEYDDRAGSVRDSAPPFTRVYLVPAAAPAPAGGPAPTARPGARTPARSGSTSTLMPPKRPTPAAPSDDPLAAVAEFLRLDLFSPVGRTADEACPPADSDAPGLTPRTFGLARFDWPRAEVVGRVAAVVGPAVTDPWTDPTAERCRAAAGKWVADLWPRLVLDPDALTLKLAGMVDAAFGGPAAAVTGALTDPLIPKGWLARLPEPERVALVMDQLARLVGRPGGQGPAVADKAVATAAGPARDRFLNDLPKLVLDLIDDPAFRPAGAIEAAHHLSAKAEELLADVAAKADEADAAAAAGFDLLFAYAFYKKGGKKPTATEFGDALRRYPTNRVRAAVLRGAADVYRAVRDALAEIGPETELYRERLAEAFARPVPPPAADPAAGDRTLLPPGCGSAEDAAQTFLRSLTDADLHALEQHVQQGLVDAFGGLLPACRTATDGLAGVVRVVREGVRRFLDARLGEVDFGGMMRARYGSAGPALEQAYHDAEPGLVGSGPWSRAEVRVYAGPAGAGGDAVRAAAVRALPAGTAEAVVSDEAVIFREYTAVPLAALPQLGPQWAAAYQQAADAAHTRTDVSRWTDVDAG